MLHTCISTGDTRTIAAPASKVKLTGTGSPPALRQRRARVAWRSPGSLGAHGALGAPGLARGGQLVLGGRVVLVHEHHARHAGDDASGESDGECHHRGTPAGRVVARVEGLTSCGALHVWLRDGVFF
ncbi:MAG: hypothetical protein Q6353_014355 [Candidatus Sigynarchaeum springense]